MKKYQIALLSGVVSIMVGSAAHASATTETADTTLLLAGSTAASAAVLNAIKSLCDTATFETYIDKTSNGGNAKAYFCRSRGVTGIVDGTKIQVRVTGASTLVGANKYPLALGGSILGVGPIAYQQKLNFLAVSPTIASFCSGDPLSATGAICDDTGAGVLAPYVPQLGISDLNPSAFIYQNAPAATGGIGTDALAKLKISPSTIQIFNPPVVKSVRDALQDLQVKAGTLAADCLTNRERGTCTPNLTGAQIAQIIGGQVTNWNQVDSGLPSKNIKLIRREIGSGTQATNNLVGMSAQYTNLPAAYPCVGGANPVILDMDHVQVVATGGSMVTALNAAETAGEWAMGLLDVTKNGAGLDTAPSASFRYINVNGVSPTLANVAAGKYVMIAQATVNRLEPWTGTPQELAIANALTTALNDPAIVAKGNTSSTLKQNFGQGGYLVVSSKSCTSDADCAANPVTAYRFAANPADAPTGYCQAPKATW